MPGSTPDYDFPFPVGTDPLQDGDDEIENLATALEDHLKGCYLKVDGSQSVTTGSPEVFLWDNEDGSAEFSVNLGTGVITYTGPNRFVAWRFGFDWGAAGPRKVIFRTTGSATIGSDNYVVNQVEGDPVNDSGLVWMVNGSTWHFVIEWTGSGPYTMLGWASFKGI